MSRRARAGTGPRRGSRTGLPLCATIPPLLAAILPDVSRVLVDVLQVRATLTFVLPEVLRVRFGRVLVAGGSVGLQLGAILVDVLGVLVDVFHVRAPFPAVLPQVLAIPLQVGLSERERRESKCQAANEHEYSAHVETPFGKRSESLTGGRCARFK